MLLIYKQPFNLPENFRVEVDFILFRKFCSIFLCLILILLVFRIEVSSGHPNIFWERLSQGLLKTSLSNESLSGHVIIIKVDLAYYNIRLLCASENENLPRTLLEWSEEFNLACVINASMFRQDKPLLSTGYMKHFEHKNNPAINPAYSSFLLFNPKNPEQPPLRFLDMDQHFDWKSIIESYNTVIQNYRMISGGSRAGWEETKRLHNIAAIGMDSKGQVLFIHSSMSASPRYFIDMLLSLPLNIVNLAYLDGGSHSALFCSVSEELTFHEPDSFATSTIRLPNVIGVAPNGFN